MRIHRNLPVYPSGWSGWLGFVLSTKGPQSQGANGSGVASTLGLLRLPSKKQLAISGRIVSSRLRSWFVFQIPSSATMSTRHEQPPLNLEGGVQYHLCLESVNNNWALPPLIGWDLANDSPWHRSVEPWPVQHVEPPEKGLRPMAFWQHQRIWRGAAKWNAGWNASVHRPIHTCSTGMDPEKYCFPFRTKSASNSCCSFHMC